jgi:hypothetical protein
LKQVREKQAKVEREREEREKAERAKVSPCFFDEEATRNRAASE